MKKRTYYYILAFWFLAIFLYEIVNMLFTIHYSSYALLKIVNIAKPLIGVFILGYETLNSKKAVSIINICLFPLIFIGMAFIIMHWPYGRELCLGSFFMILVMLFIDAIRDWENRDYRLLILVWPLCHFLYMVMILNHLPLRDIAALFLLLVVGAISFGLFYKLSKEKN